MVKVGVIPTDPLKKLGNEDVLTLAWNVHTPNQNIQANLLLNLDESDYALLDLGNPSLDTFEAFEREIQTLEEIRDFLGYLKESREASMEYLGPFRDRETLTRLLPIMKKQIPKIADLGSLEDYLLDLQERILAYYRIYRQVQSLPFQTGDVITTLSSDCRPINQEKLIQHEKGYLLLPTETEWDAIDDEPMSKEVLCGYLFTLLVEERCALIYSHSSKNGEFEKTILECEVLETAV